MPTNKLRETKIVATLGPATDRPGVLEDMIKAGLDVVRVNFSHGEADDHRQRVKAVREAAAKLNKDVAVLVDLQGPKIRIDGFKDGKINLKNGAEFTLDPNLAADAGDETQVGLGYKSLPQEVEAGDILLLNDGLISLICKRVEGQRVICEVEMGGELSARKGINKKGGGLSAEALTEKDFADIVTAAELNADYLAVSFPKCAADMELARKALREAGGDGRVLAKIERAEAVDNMAEILAASDAVMVARGDLGVEIGDPQLPGVQKQLIQMAREMNRPCITATQMMESMIHNSQPTRAEVMDVANAVLDGTDAVMLSAETAMGDYPVQVIETVARVCIGAENASRSEELIRRGAANLESHFKRTDEAIAMATMYTARHMQANAIVALTESGETAVWMSRLQTRTPIYALTQHEATRRRLALCRGVYPMNFCPESYDPYTVGVDALSTLVTNGTLKPGQRILLTKGDANSPGGTNTMKVVEL